jgi:hypothetical protein
MKVSSIVYRGDADLPEFLLPVHLGGVA